MYDTIIFIKAFIFNITEQAIIHTFVHKNNIILNRMKHLLFSNKANIIQFANILHIINIWIAFQKNLNSPYMSSFCITTRCNVLVKLCTINRTLNSELKYVHFYSTKQLIYKIS